MTQDNALGDHPALDDYICEKAGFKVGLATLCWDDSVSGVRCTSHAPLPLLLCLAQFAISAILSSSVWTLMVQQARRTAGLSSGMQWLYIDMISSSIM